MEDRWIDRFAQVMGRVVPDAITASVLLLLLLFGAALACGDSVAATMNGYYQGLWMLLPFTMQMTLIIVLSSVLAVTPFFRKGIVRLSRLPSTRNRVVLLAVLTTAAAAYLYWGLSIALGPIIAVHFAREAERKGIAVDFPFLLAVTWASGAVWQFGFSASAPLLVATPGHFLEKTIGIIPLAKTIWSAPAITHVIAFTLAVIATGILLMPKNCRPFSTFPSAFKLLEPAAVEPARTFSFSEQLERSSFSVLALCVVLAGWLYVHFITRRQSLDINALNTILLFSALLLHRNLYAFTAALQRAITAGWPVIVLYHLYAGIAGVIQFTSIGERLAGIVAAVATPLTFPLFTAVISAIFAVFIPSSGGQWAVQGLVTVKSAMAVGVSVERSILALSLGDHVGNLTSPFWCVIIAGIAQVDFRTFFGYGLLFAVIWFAIGAVVFTFVPG